MKLIVGLGNPGIKYRNTRHNIGFLIMERLADKLNISISREKFKGFYTKTSHNNTDIVLLKPQTFMNLSGQSVLSAVNFFKIPVKDILVLHDELDLSFGKIRFKKGGGFAGHNGLKSIGNLLGSKDFNRLRFGIGRPGGKIDVSDYVLQRFSDEESAILDDLIEKSVDAILFYLENGILKAMNQFHGG